MLYFLKNKHLHHPKYVQKATEDNISAVYRPDRKALLDYLYGKETKDLKNIDEMVSLEMPTKSHEFKNSSAEVSGQIGQIITETTIDGDQRIGIKERMERKHILCYLETFKKVDVLIYKILTIKTLRKLTTTLIRNFHRHKIFLRK